MPAPIQLPNSSSANGRLIEVRTCTVQSAADLNASSPVFWAWAFAEQQQDPEASFFMYG